MIESRPHFVEGFRCREFCRDVQQRIDQLLLRLTPVHPKEAFVFLLYLSAFPFDFQNDFFLLLIQGLENLRVLGLLQHLEVLVQEFIFLQGGLLLGLDVLGVRRQRVALLLE